MSASNPIILLVVGVLVPYLLLLMLIVVTTIDKNMLNKIKTVNDFKSKVKSFSLRRRPFSLTEHNSLSVLREQLLIENDKFCKRQKILYRLIVIILINIYLILIKYVVVYHLTTELDYKAPLVFPILEITTLIAMSSWICGVLSMKLFIYRIGLFIDKLKVLETEIS